MTKSGTTLSRRRFFDLAATAAGAVAVSGRVRAQGPRGANDKVRIGLIGSGSRGRSVAAQFIRSFADVQHVANCDAYATRLDQGNEQLSGLQKDVKLEGYEDYRRILDRKDVDVVHIATPDHWHCQMLIDAMAAGKDVYLEKPLSNTVERAVEALSAYKSANRVVQFGTQQRSGAHFQEAAKIVQDGQLGKITCGDPVPWQRLRHATRTGGTSPAGTELGAVPGTCSQASVQAGSVALARVVGLRRWTHHRLGCPPHGRGARHQSQRVGPLLTSGTAQYVNFVNPDAISLPTPSPSAGSIRPS